MNFDISHLLEHWDYQPGQVVVRKFTAKDGVVKIQLRVDLGLLQMNAEGRPDGKHPLGYPSIYDYYQTKLYKHLAANEGSDAGFRLKPEDCAKIQLEALQYHHRYICLLELEDFDAVVRDTERNLAVFEFVKKHADSEDLIWSIAQFKPQLLLIQTRAQARQALTADDFNAAILFIEGGLTQIQEFYREHSRNELAEQSSEVNYLKNWLEEVSARRPLTKREQLEKALSEAVNNEDYERAAQVRDELRNLKSTE
jgi:hypothetical protein